MFIQSKHFSPRCCALLALICGFTVEARAQATAPRLAAQRTSGLSRVRYFGFEAYKMSDGRSEAIVVPALGRVMRFGLVGEKNLLWNSNPGPARPGVWRNWGGDKAWPGPQNLWPLSIGQEWPPDTSWDGEAYQSTVLSGGRLRITSGLWPRWACRVVREFGFDSNGDFSITQTFEKVSGAPVELSLWNITQVATPQAVFIASNPDSTYKKQYHWLTKPQKPVDIAPVRPDLLRIMPNGGSMYKIGIDSPFASLIVVSEGLAFKQKTAKISGNYPDGAQGSGFPVEVFDFGGSGESHYMETELLSPLRTFYAGTSWTTTVKWSLQKVRNTDLEAPGFVEEIQALLRQG